MRDTLPKEVGQAIHILRRLRGLSMQEFAERAQLSATYLRQVERGERDLGLGALGLIAQGLQCDPRLLLPGDGRSPVASVVAELFDQAHESLQNAILFLLMEPDDSPRKQAMLALASEDPERSRPAAPPRSRPPERVVSGRAAPPSSRRTGK
ncbi:transcriptional regulator [Sorangium cellulosum]|jgi:transcriptional regulator with XRE-family HTH domain|uniref:Transcriptional regulator n=1 Tax=Sorangium cellulosum TaxID=56 RepID=A0A4P2Q9G8_SORCE|nr:helix-turn-helix transcriptional regulator [Sorangium cellulosum]AUX26267.1 transcriptional regulator [Sorangium cellulosum]